MPEFDLEHPPWSEEAGGTGDSDDWGDEQDRSDWFADAAHHYAARVAELEAKLAAIPVQHIAAILDYNWPQEQRDYEEQHDGAEGAVFTTEGERVWHIFERLRLVDDWLNLA